MNKPKHIHFTGIKGVGMTPLAIIAKEAGKIVTGSDIDETFITDEPLQKAGIDVFPGFSPEHISPGVDLVIATGAHGGMHNVEVLSAKEKNIPIMMQGQAVGEYMKGELFGRTFQGISVAGSHGKTTTTAMIATVFKSAGMDPSYVIGTSDIPAIGLPGHFGHGEYFIAEADEYATEPTIDKTTKFLWQHPRIAVVTNIELDHTDIYPNIESLTEQFETFVNNLPTDGLLVINGDNEQNKLLLKNFAGRYVTYGLSPDNEYSVSRISVSGGQVFFWATQHGTSLGEFALRVPGEHNVANALAVIAVAQEAGIRLEEVHKALRTYTGSKRRAELLGTLPTGAIVYDDYAHHPTEISQTLKAFRAQYPKEHIVAIFQPHTFSRTRELFEQFLTAFSQADEVILADIYPSMREAPDPAMSSSLLAQRMTQHHKNVFHGGGLADVVEYVTKKGYDHHTLVLIMGAGDIYKIAQELDITPVSV